MLACRHGARTPLTDASYLWEGQEWNVGGPAYKAVPLQLFDVNGGPAGPNEHDQKQVSTKLAGGTSKGELTKLGQLQALELGYWLRQQYIDTYGFLPASLKPGVVAARTTNFSRTRATLAGVLTGLYPGVTQPIPVTTSGDLDEILYADTKRCPHLKVLMQASEAMLKASWESPSRAQGIKQLQQQLTQLLNLPEGAWDKRWMMSDVHDAFTSLAAHGKALPHGLTEEMKEAVDRLATEEISAFICPALVDEHGHAVLRLSMGRLLDILLANMETAAAAAAGQAGSSSSSSSHAKLMMFSGHDSTIMPLLTALGCDLQRWPPYISNLVFELWELKPPTHQLQNNMAAGNAAAASSSSSSSSSEAPGPFVVRVLYNKQPLRLPGAAEGNAAAASSSCSSSSSEAPGPFVVRVLYNKQPLQLPGAAEGEQYAVALAWTVRDCLWRIMPAAGLSRISNFVFELWELKPPTHQLQNNMAARNAAAAASSSSSSSSEAPGPFVVRVLYNKQPLQLPGAAEGEQYARALAWSVPDCLWRIMPAVGLSCISNLVFELWELKPPTHQLQNNMAAGNAAAASSSSSSSSGISSEAPGPFVVRVLHNKQPLQLPGAAEANPTLLELGTFKHEVLAPFILSEEQHAQACSMPISHDSSLPHPEGDEAANGKPQEEFSMASGGAGQQQQQQQGELQPPPGTQALSQSQRQQQQQQQRQPQGKL
uniref:Uncharacterized protein n=1 Tax=Tetradesmus obliquus TaxID=3088 RepID=A0A383VZ21_TETOB|eukprot:jgi/Sobl393_1/11944/SZX70119.1